MVGRDLLTAGEYRPLSTTSSSSGEAVDTNGKKKMDVESWTN
jgi:hypothetical protein